MSDQPIKCSGCNTQAQVIVEHGRPQTVLCPDCGAQEAYEQVVESIGAQASDFAADQIRGALEKSTRGNKNIRFERGVRPRRSAARFKIELGS